MHDSLINLAEGLIAHAMRGRRDLLEATVRQREAEAKRHDGQQSRYYAQAQESTCVHELHDRADIIWQSYVRVITEAGSSWDSDLRKVILGRVAADMDREAPPLDQFVRTAIGGFHSFTSPVHTAKPLVIERIGIELDLFALRYQPTPYPLKEQLSAPRYHAALVHLEKSNAFLVADPVDLENAVKEAVSMAEALAKLAANEPNDTLGKCISTLHASGRLPDLLAKSLRSFWADSNNEAGIRHAHNNKAPLTAGHARYLVDQAHAAAKFFLEIDC